MDIDSDGIITRAISDALREGVSKHLTSGYNSPLKKLMELAVAANKAELSGLLTSSIAACVTDDVFCAEIRAAVRTQLAKLLVQRFGGELEKQVNALKSDPTTRARITLALDDIVKSRES